MTAHSDESKVVIPFMPSLQHLASVKIAVPLFQKFGIETLKEAFSEIQEENFTTSEGNAVESLRAGRAKANLLDVPPHLRLRIMEAVNGAHQVISDWKLYHSFLFHEKLEEYNILWRSDGSIDAVKTAHNLVRNTKLGSRARFEIACFYCMEESVKALWAQMVKSGETEYYRTRRYGIVFFWIQRMRERSPIPWQQSLIQSLEAFLPLDEYYLFFRPRIPRLSVWFSLLRPEQKQKYSFLLSWVSRDDFRFCLYSLTKEEEEQILNYSDRLCLSKLLNIHLAWPLQTLFLETVQNLWNYIDDDRFHGLIFNILYLIRKYKDFYYSELFEKFWNSSPIHLRESARKDTFLREKINSFFADKRRKRIDKDE